LGFRFCLGLCFFGSKTGVKKQLGTMETKVLKKRILGLANKFKVFRYFTWVSLTLLHLFKVFYLQNNKYFYIGTQLLKQISLQNEKTSFKLAKRHNIVGFGHFWRVFAM
jgi:hypothetical protein